MEVPFACAAHIQILTEAFHAFRLGAMFGGSNVNADCEAKYLRLYHDYADHPDTWFECILTSDENHIVAERSCGIFGTLAMIQRKRGDLAKAHETIQIYTRVMNIYRDMCSRCSIPAQQRECEGLTYKHDLVVSNTYQQMGNKELCLPSFRRGVEYEIRNEVGFDAEELAFLIPAILGHNNPKYSPLTMAKFRDISEKKCWECLKIASMGEKGHAMVANKMKKCAFCGQTEPTKGDYMQCSLCKEVCFCGKDCQRKHWRSGHKKTCKGRSQKKKAAPAKSSKQAGRAGPPSNDSSSHIPGSAVVDGGGCKVDDATLMEVAELLSANFATTVCGHTPGHVISEEQRGSAKVALVPFIKDVLVTPKCAHLNSPVTFADGCRDEIFLAELNSFMEEQSGYESLVEIHKKDFVQEYQQELTSPQHLRVDDTFVEEKAKTLVKMISKGMLQANPNWYATKAQRKGATKAVGVYITQKMLSSPEYNSYSGFSKLMNDSPGMQDEVGRLIMAEFGVKDDR